MPTKTILVVDDVLDNLIVLQQVIAEYLPGCTVVTARSADEVLGLAGRTSLDAALIDVQMPRMDGIEMCRRLKAADRGVRVPVILLTSHSTSAALMARGLEAGADDFICRPIDNLELVARIKAVLRVKEAEDALRRMNTRLEEAVEERTEELRKALEHRELAAREILTAQEEERARIARELHDGLGQTLTAVHLELERLRRSTTVGSPPADDAVDGAMAMLQTAARELRHICKGLRPPLLDDLGLEPAMRELVKEFEESSQIKTELEIGLRGSQASIPADVALCTYRILQESLHNIKRHAGARKVSISLVNLENELQLAVDDDGCGFNPREPDRTDGWGIVGMRERSKQVRGTVDICSVPLKGTRLTFRAPLTAAPGGGARVWRQR